MNNIVKLSNKISRFIYLIKLFVRGNINNFQILKMAGLVNYIKSFSIDKMNEEIGIVAIIKNETPYLIEWIEYHRIIMGISVFYIYDNGSTDNPEALLQRYILKGIVKYKKFPGKSMQNEAYLDCIKKAKREVDWLITIDIDEFVQSVQGISLVDWLEALPKNVSQVEIGWMIFGSSGFKERPSGLVTENFIYHATDDFCADYKPIVRPSRVFNITFPHFYWVSGKTIDENRKRLWYYPYHQFKGAKAASKAIFRINHYYSKSLQEFHEKAARGDALIANRALRTDKDFLEHDKNEVKDESMTRYSKIIRESEYYSK